MTLRAGVAEGMRSSRVEGVADAVRGCCWCWLWEAIVLVVWREVDMVVREIIIFVSVSYGMLSYGSSTTNNPYHRLEVRIEATIWLGLE